jgi:hypothetical protein
LKFYIFAIIQFYNNYEKSKIILGIALLISLFYSCSSGERNKKDQINDNNFSNLNIAGNIDTFKCVSKISNGYTAILSIVRNNTTGFVTIHRDSAISGSNDFPTVYFDKSLINNYTETQNSIRLNIPENEVYYFIPFEKDPNGGNIP